MNTIRRKGIASFAALSILGAVLVTGAASPAAGTVYQGNCRGADAATQGLLSVLGGSLSLPIEVTGNVPETVAPDDGAFPVDFSWTISVDGASSDFDAIWGVIGSDTLSASIKNIELPVLISGGGTTATDVTGNPADRDVTVKKGESLDMSEGPFAADIPITGDAGTQIIFTVGTAALTMGVNVPSLGGAIDLALACDIGRKFATTTVAVEGAPTIKSVDEQVDKGGTVTVDVNELITEGDSPLIPDSLEISTPPEEGTATLVDGVLTYVAPDADTEVSIGLRVCGEEIEVVPASDGADEVQELVYDDEYNVGKKPVTLTFIVNETETELIVLVEPGGIAIFQPPRPQTAAELQASLETAPGVNPGDIEVTGGPDEGDRLGTQSNPYTITYMGGLAATDIAELAVGQFQGWPPRAWLDAIIEFASGLGGGGDGGDGGETDGGTGNPLLDGFLENLDVGAIIDGLTNLFPKQPAATTLTQGEAPAEAEMSGPLCGAGTVSITVGAGTAQEEVVVASATQTPAPAATAVSAQPTFTG